MIVEHVYFDILPGREAEFEAALGEALQYISAAEGFQGLEARRCIETPNRYLLLVGWDSVEAHMVGFRESENYQKWRALIGPLFANPPAVEHYADPVAYVSVDGADERD